VSRSASIVIAWLMAQKKMSFDAAYEFLLAKRPIVCPNSGFQKQLQEYEAALKDRKSKCVIA
jgi:protein-tyrosine phosphatase